MHTQTNVNQFCFRLNSKDCIVDICTILLETREVLSDPEYCNFYNDLYSSEFKLQTFIIF